MPTARHQPHEMAKHPRLAYRPAVLGAAVAELLFDLHDRLVLVGVARTLHRVGAGERLGELCSVAAHLLHHDQRLLHRHLELPRRVASRRRLEFDEGSALKDLVAAHVDHLNRPQLVKAGIRAEQWPASGGGG